LLAYIDRLAKMMHRKKGKRKKEKEIDRLAEMMRCCVDF